MRTTIRTTLIGFILVGSVVWAEEVSPESEPAAVLENKFTTGIFYTALGSPYPALLGFGVGFNMVKSLRLEMALGTTSTNAEIPTLSVGLKYRLLAKRISPVFGLNLSSGEETAGPKYSPAYSSYPGGNYQKDKRGHFVSCTVGFEIETSETILLMAGTSWGITKRNGKHEVHPYFGVGLKF